MPLDSLEYMDPQFSEIGDIDIAIGDNEKFCQGQLAFSEYAQAAGKGLSRVSIGYLGSGQTVKTGFAKSFQFFDPLHHQGKEGREQLLEKITNKKIFLPGTADHRRRIDSIVAVIEMAHLENRIIVLQ